MQTPEAVVEKALKAVKGRKPLIISGLANYIGAVLGTIAPDSLVTRVVGNVLRPKLKEKK
jgi:short-subunit dehydrogenase